MNKILRQLKTIAFITAYIFIGLIGIVIHLSLVTTNKRVIAIGVLATIIFIILGARSLDNEEE